MWNIFCVRTGAIFWSAVRWRHRGHEDFAHHGQSHSHQRQSSSQIPHSPLPELVSFQNAHRKMLERPTKGRTLKHFLSFLSLFPSSQPTVIRSFKVSSLMNLFYHADSK